MKNENMSSRQLKNKVLELLQSDDFAQGLDVILRLPLKQVVNPLFSFLCSVDERVKWRAISALGSVVSDIAASDPESARVIMRRFIWQLNDESGGIGWGCPESMAEVMARNETLAKEYVHILISYIDPDGNYLDHPLLQQGALWGVGRLAHSRPIYVRDAAALLNPYMESEDPILRGLAAWAAGPIAREGTVPHLKKLTSDQAILTLYHDDRFIEYSVGTLAQEALATVEGQ
ncbi:MAG TPA: HEAT repeat domain-containing protein [Syntrophales bacterium]|nr:HEAT repeat domain-containing protein [Syntrophales bacterium]HPQ43136.1 HEAT repeat domain-containing protein [Syntrophales bacterium]